MYVYCPSSDVYVHHGPQISHAPELVKFISELPKAERLVAHDTSSRSSIHSPVAGPSSMPSTNGPVSLFVTSSGLDAIFMSSDPLQNILGRDSHCIYSHLYHHGIPSHGLSVVQARQAVVFHLLSGMCATKLPNGSLVLPHHRCISVSTDFDSPQHMSYAAHSILISAALSQDKIDVVANVLNVAVM